MKLEDLRKKAKAGEADPDCLGTCELEGCNANATNRDSDGSWCWTHREEKSFRYKSDSVCPKCKSTSVEIVYHNRDTIQSVERIRLECCDCKAVSETWRSPLK